MGTGTFYVPPILPYDNQLPADAARKFLPEPAPPAPLPPPILPPGLQVPPINVLPDEPVPVPGEAIPVGNPWYGPVPPVNPSFGWMWCNSNNNHLYIYIEPGVWLDKGTNW